MEKMKLYIFILIAVAGMGLYSCSPKPAQNETQGNVKYYRNLLFSETSWDLERGNHELTAGEAKTINNYKITYNENGQIASVEYNRNDSLLNYSSMGAAKITYTYEGNLQKKHFFDEKGAPTKNGGASVFEYTLNDEGMRIAMRFLDETGQPVENRNSIHNYVWTKMPDGMIQEKRYNLAGEMVIMNPFCPFYELRFSYDTNGYVTRMANFDNDTLYNCTAENCGDIGVSYFQFKNNEHGDLLSFSVHNTTGRMSNLYWGWAKRVNEFDANGCLTETAMFDQDDEYLGGKGIPVTQTIYDEHGAPVKRISMDKDRNVINDPNSGVAVTEYKYDEAGRRVETLVFDKEGNPVERKS
jgi:YD repeat-containing protein